MYYLSRPVFYAFEDLLISRMAQRKNKILLQRKKHNGENRLLSNLSSQFFGVSGVELWTEHSSLRKAGMETPSLLALFECLVLRIHAAWYELQTGTEWNRIMI